MYVRSVHRGIPISDLSECKGRCRSGERSTSPLRGQYCLHSPPAVLAASVMYNVWHVRSRIVDIQILHTCQLRWTIHQQQAWCKQNHHGCLVITALTDNSNTATTRPRGRHGVSGETKAPGYSPSDRVVIRKHITETGSVHDDTKTTQVGSRRGFCIWCGAVLCVFHKATLLVRFPLRATARHRTAPWS